MKYHITHTTKYSYASSASLCQNKLHLAPRPLEHQTVHNFRLIISPDPNSESNSDDFFGNRVDYFEIAKPHTSLSITAVSQVALAARPPQDDMEQGPTWEAVLELLKEDPQGDLLECRPYVYPSKFVPVEKTLAAYARESFPTGRKLLACVRDLTRRIFEEFTYDPEATTISTPVLDVFQHRKGVCQDFAHLQISCLRSLGIPARYVSGYLRTKPPPGQAHQRGRDESHAWLAAYCGPELGWIDFDPTNNLIPTLDHVTVGWGRDYADLCPIQGVFTGGGQSTMSVSVDLREIPEGPR